MIPTEPDITRLSPEEKRHLLVFNVTLACFIFAVLTMVAFLGYNDIVPKWIMLVSCVVMMAVSGVIVSCLVQLRNIGRVACEKCGKMTMESETHGINFLPGFDTKEIGKYCISCVDDYRDTFNRTT